MTLKRIFDTSSYQAYFDYAGSAGDAFMVKATEGPFQYYRSPSFSFQLAVAQGTGKPTIAYHYVRGTDVAGQVAAVVDAVPKSVPVALDLEAGGDLATTRALAAALRSAGYVVPLLYCPKWWLSANGGSAQNTADIAPLWSSNYTEYSDSGPGWTPYGGQTPVLWQYSSSISVGGYSSVDCSAFRGTPDQLAALFGGNVTTPGDFAHATLDVDLGGGSLADFVRANNGYAAATGSLSAKLDAIKSELDALVAKVNTLPTSTAPATVDLDALATKIAAKVTAGASLADIKALLNSAHLSTP